MGQIIFHSLTLNLADLYLSKNNFSSVDPISLLPFMSSTTLFTLDLSDCLLTGPLPPLSSMSSSLSDLNLARNRLSSSMTSLQIPPSGLFVDLSSTLISSTRSPRSVQVASRFSVSEYTYPSSASGSYSYVSSLLTLTNTSVIGQLSSSVPLAIQFGNSLCNSATTCSQVPMIISVSQTQLSRFQPSTTVFTVNNTRYPPGSVYCDVTDFEVDRYLFSVSADGDAPNYSCSLPPFNRSGLALVRLSSLLDPNPTQPVLLLHDAPCPPGSAYDDVTSGCEQALPGFYSNGDQILPCPPGSFSSVNGSIQCTPCLIGTFANSSGQSSCRSADVGFFVNQSGSSLQHAAPPGYFSLQQGSIAPQPCSVGEYQPLEGQPRCLSCPSDSTTNRSSAISIDECLCIPSTYGNVRTGCLPCTIGMTCPRLGMSLPNVTRGFFPSIVSKNGSLVLFVTACIPREACLGGEPTAISCNDGYEGSVIISCGGVLIRTHLSLMLGDSGRSAANAALDMRVSPMNLVKGVPHAVRAVVSLSPLYLRLTSSARSCSTLAHLRIVVCSRHL